MFNAVLYFLAVALLVVSFIKDKNKTVAALKKAWKSFSNVLPEFFSIIMLIGILLALLDAQVISQIIGRQSGWLGVVIAAVVGSITLIPGFVAFPTAQMLIENGAGYMQVGAFISTLMMVGIVTIPVEMKYFGRKLTLWRNLLAFIFSFFVAFVIGKAAGSL